MSNLATRLYRYSVARLTGKFEEHARIETRLDAQLAETKKSYAKLKDNTAEIMTQHNLAEARVTKAQASLKSLETELNSTLTSQAKLASKGDESGAQALGRHARTLATSIAATQDSIPVLVEQADIAQAASAQAQQALKGAEALVVEKTHQLQTLKTRNSSAEMAKAISAIATSVTDSGAGSELQAIEEVIERKVAKAHAQMELATSSEAGTRLSAKAALSSSRADDILNAATQVLPKKVQNQLTQASE